MPGFDSIRSSGESTRRRDCEVAVLGAGLAGACAALALLARGVNVAIVEVGAAGGELGAESDLILRGACAHAAAFAATIGPRRYSRLAAAAEEGRAFWLSTVGERGRALRLTTTIRRVGDPDRLDAERAALAYGGVEARPHDGASLAVDDDLLVDRAACLARARDLAITRGAAQDSIAGDFTIRSDYAGATIEAREGTIRADRVVLAIGAALPRFDPWAREIVMPALARELVSVPNAAGIGAATELFDDALVRHADARGALVVADGRGGAEATRDPESSSRVAADPWSPRFAAHRAALEERAPGVGIAGAFLRPRLYSCDGLPLVGPHPMRAGVLLCDAFDALESALALSAATLLAEWIVDGRPRDEESARLFSPRRML